MFLQAKTVSLNVRLIVDIDMERSISVGASVIGDSVGVGVTGTETGASVVGE
jgi:hypothetical protein